MWMIIVKVHGTNSIACLFISGFIVYWKHIANTNSEVNLSERRQILLLLDRLRNV
jgi:hypothetical protein